MILAVSFVFYIRVHALSCLVVESDCVSVRQLEDSSQQDN